MNVETNSLLKRLKKVGIIIEIIAIIIASYFYVSNAIENTKEKRLVSIIHTCFNSQKEAQEKLCSNPENNNINNKDCNLLTKKVKLNENLKLFSEIKKNDRVEAYDIENGCGFKPYIVHYNKEYGMRISMEKLQIELMKYLGYLGGFLIIQLLLTATLRYIIAGKFKI